MKWFVNIVAVLLILVGAVWFLQGVNVLLGSMMSGNPLYSVIGGILVVVGIALLYFGNRRAR